jgi:uncharacterized protein with HEPN domain
LERDELYLRDIMEAADAIAAFISGMREASFVGNDLVRSAVLQKLTVIGEAAARMSPALKSRYAEIDWRDIVAFRNIAVHAYFSVDWSVVWLAAAEDVPELRGHVLAILAAEFRGFSE